MNLTQRTKEYHSSHSLVYSCQYHVIWCTKYRRPVLTEEMQALLKECVKEKESEYGYDVHETQAMADHTRLILIYNQDQPGMIGLIGTILGNNHINIADMTVGRSHIGELAVTIINIDSAVPHDVLQHISNQDQISFVKQVKL